MVEPVTRRVALAGLPETEALAAALAARAGPGDFIALSGPLGAGKTAFARFFIRSLGVTEEVPSPTFTLLQTYAAPGGREIAHFDLYRLESPDDVWELGWDDVLPRAITLLEWPERLSGGRLQGRLLPADRLDIAIGADAGESAIESRQVTLTGHGSWRRRLTGIGA